MIPHLWTMCCAVYVSSVSTATSSYPNSISLAAIDLYRSGYLPKVRPLLLLYESVKIIGSRIEIIRNLGMGKYHILNCINGTKIYPIYKPPNFLDLGHNLSIIKLDLLGLCMYGFVGLVSKELPPPGVQP